jgi:hypothetical protein
LSVGVPDDVWWCPGWGEQEAGLISARQSYQTAVRSTSNACDELPAKAFHKPQLSDRLRKSSPSKGPPQPKLSLKWLDMVEHVCEWGATVGVIWDPAGSWQSQVGAVRTEPLEDAPPTLWNRLESHHVHRGRQVAGRRSAQTLFRYSSFTLLLRLWL